MPTIDTQQQFNFNCIIGWGNKLYLCAIDYI